VVDNGGFGIVVTCVFDFDFFRVIDIEWQKFDVPSEKVRLCDEELDVANRCTSDLCCGFLYSPVDQNN